MKVNMGCGTDYRKGWLNVDIRDDVIKDINHDINEAPLSAKADLILLNDVLEHLNEKGVENITKSLKTGGLLTGTTPHYLSRNAYNEFAHCRYISINTFRDSYVFRDYRVESLRIVYDLTNKLSWSMPYWFVRIQERVFPGLFPPTKIEFNLRKIR